MGVGGVHNALLILVFHSLTYRQQTLIPRGIFSCPPHSTARDLKESELIIGTREIHMSFTYALKTPEFYSLA